MVELWTKRQEHRRERTKPERNEKPLEAAIVLALRVPAVDHSEALGRKRIERVVIDALITGAWANDQTCLGRRLTVTRQFEFDLSQITIGIESHSLAGIETRRVVVNRKLDLS